MKRTTRLRRAAFGVVVAVAGLAGEAISAGPVAAQEIVRPRTPRLVLRPAPLPEELAARPGFPAPRYDPWLGVVRPETALDRPGPDRVPSPSALDLIAWTRAARAAAAERLRTRAWAEAIGRLPETEIEVAEDSLDVPEPLARVFGEGSEFDVRGRLHLAAVGSRSRQKPDLRSELLRRTVGGLDLDLDQILDLEIAGSVGEKLDVAVDFDSSREFDSKQLISAVYTGEEDEVLRRVEVGDIRVELPASRFLGSDVALGTFGALAVAGAGSVDLRVLGSRKEGQSVSRTLTIAPTGEGILQEVTLDIKDTQFQNDRFFLLFHPDSVAGARLAYPNEGTRLVDPGSGPTPGSLDVWIDDGVFTNNRERASKAGVARVNPTDPAAFPEQTHTGFFDLLVEGEDYAVTDGVVLHLKRQLNDDEVLGVAYRTRRGERVGTPKDAPELELKLIKPINPDTLDFTWDYTLRNVYSLREPNIRLGSLALAVYRGNRDLKRTFEVVEGESRKYSEIFGITDRNGRAAVPRILRDPFGGSDWLVFPDVRPFFRPTTESGRPIPIEVPNRSLYFNSDPRRTALDDQVYFIEASYLSRGGLTGEVELGAANLLEGSERITIGGRTLVRGEDYQIFYDFGKVVFTDPAGLAERHPDAPVEIRFEVAPLFNLAPTSLWGAAGTWTLGEEAAVHSTLLVQNRESLANRPILGAEPTRTMIGTADGAWSREVPALTRWVDALPGVETEAASRIGIRGEIAWSAPDPNTEGRVFLNDFESVEIARPLSLFFRAWRFSSRPAEAPFGLGEPAHARWYTFAVDSRLVTPGGRGVDRGDDLFVVQLQPVGETAGERRDSWRSIALVLSPTGEDVTRQEFVEFFVRGDRGRILVDLGAVDEDAVRLDVEGRPVGVGRLDTEETNPDTRDNNLDVGEDTGLDGVAGRDDMRVPGDVGNDDFDETFIGGFPANPNGTENNGVLDTEDHDLDGVLDRREDLARWEIDLAGSEHEVAGGRTATGFRRIRLPLANPDARIGNPDLRNARVLRLTFSGVEQSAAFEIARLEIVGSTFLKRGIVAVDGTPLAGPNSDSLRVAAVNDIENPDYFSPPGVVAIQERADEVAGIADIVREQSLELEFVGLPPGARGTIFRPLFDRESYIDYERMRVWVQGRRIEPGGESPLFFVAFGLDTLNVYEYAAPLLRQEWEEHVIDFAVFTELKRALVDSLDAVGATLGTRVSEDGRYRVRIASETTPPPTVTEVSQLTIGVENSTPGTISGSFWINEWRLTEPVREADVARYVHVDAGIADLAEVRVSYESRGARYRDLGAGRNDFERGALDVNAVVRLDRFLPESWGVAMPLVYDHLGRSAAPLFRVGSDIRLSDGSVLREDQTRSHARDVVTLRIFRAETSENPLLAATLDRLEGRVTYRRESFGSVDLATDAGRWDAWIGYRHGFQERALPLGLGWIARLPWPEPIRESAVIRALADAEFNPLPAQLSLTARSVAEERTREKELFTIRDFTADTTRTLSGVARMSFQPFASMRATVGWDDTRDLVFPETVVSRGTLGVGAMRSQTLDFDWAPPISSWLTPHYGYATTYVRDHTREASRAVDSLDLRDFSVTTDETISVTFAPPLLVEAITGRTTESESVWWKRTFEPIRFDVRRRRSVSYVQQAEEPDFGFAFGFGDLTDVAGEDPQSMGGSESTGLSTGLVLPGGARMRAGYRSIEDVRQWYQGRTEGTSRTWPDLEFRWANFRIPGISPVVSGATIASDFERREGDRGANGELLEDFDRTLWDPVVSLTLVWANGMTTDLRASRSESHTRTVRNGLVDSRREEETSDLIFALNYRMQPGTPLYFPLPGLWGVELRRPLIAALTVARRDREDRTARVRGGGPGGVAINAKVRTTEVRPSLSYEFGRMVSGLAFSYLAREDAKREITNTTTTLEAYLDFLF